MKNLTTSLKALRLSGDGELFAAPAGLKAFGLPLAQVAFNPEADQGDALSTAVFAPGVTFEQVRKAAALKAEKWAADEKLHALYQGGPVVGQAGRRDSTEDGMLARLRELILG
ncbi:hypothetical protein LP419_23465 [Massilia sp. H-1]|nr:hypothetical protein LP419_23465 [Massilia sp. H-1]